MRILFLTQYFPPEVGAPQNRLFELALRLQKQNIKVDVLTAMPNYPGMEVHDAYKGKTFTEEKMEGLSVYRSWIYVSKSRGIFMRLLNYFSFVFSAFWCGVFKTGRYDLVLCESPPLFLGITAYLLCLIKGAKMVFNVSDLWPESAEKLGLVRNPVFLKMAYWLEGFLYSKSSLVCGQTQGIVNDIINRFPNVDTHWLKNGVDCTLFNPNNIKTKWRLSNGYTYEDVLFAYAGILGHAQGLEIILEAAQSFKDREGVYFLFFGSGPEEEKLKRSKLDWDLSNVHFYPVQKKENMPLIIKDIDVSIIPLKKLDLFLGAIPSKIFENLAMEKAVLLGVDGEAKNLFVEEGKCARYFEPENVGQLISGIKYFIDNPNQISVIGKKGRLYVQTVFERDAIASGLVKALKAL